MAILPAPVLDARGYEELLEALKRRIPVHSTLWTDHNPSDPGITLLELFAWLEQDLIYRLNQVPPQLKREWLNLLQIPLRPARPARAWVRCELPRGRLESVALPFGGASPRTVTAAGGVEFQTLGALEVLPVQALAAVKLPVTLPTDPNAPEGQGVESLRDLLQDHLTDEQGRRPRLDTLDPYETHVLPDPEAGRLPPPVDIAGAVDRSLWVALLAPSKDLVARVRERLAGALVSLGIRLDESLCGSMDAECCDPEGKGCHNPELEGRWQGSTDCFKCGEPRIDQLIYKRIRIAGDGTFGLSRSGVVQLQLPSDPGAIGVWTSEQFEDPDLMGAGELPPSLNAPALEERIALWLRSFQIEAIGTRVFWVAANVVEVEQAVTAPPEMPGFGKGRPGQVLRLANRPVIDGSLLLEVEEPEGWVRWSQVPQLALSRPEDRHYTLDPRSGEVCFGDGVHGRFPAARERIRVSSYRYGGGVQGNVPAGAIDRVARGADLAELLRVENPLPASGGQDRETPEEALFRIPGVLRHRDRAVARDDFRDLALETPGAGVGRVRVLPRHQPWLHADGVPGIVTLVIVPSWDPVHPNEPAPDRELLRRVCSWLEPRRLVTTELCLIPPEYGRLWISAAIELEDCYGIQTVRHWCELAVRQFLAPLPPYGPAAEGWPFDREVRGKDIEGVLARVEGVRCVNQVRLEGLAIDRCGRRTEVEGVLPLLAWQLPAVQSVQINAGIEAEAIEQDCKCEPPVEPPERVILPIPVIREVC